MTLVPLEVSSLMAVGEMGAPTQPICTSFGKALRHAGAVDEVDDAVQSRPEVPTIVVFISTGNVAIQ